MNSLIATDTFLRSLEHKQKMKTVLLFVHVSICVELEEIFPI